MTILEVTQANRGTEIYGLSSGQTLFTAHESRCFWFAAFNGHQLKISKKTLRLCRWGSQSTSPVFAVVEFEPVDDQEAWQKADDAKVAAYRANH